jgi:hypothetical protein
MRYPQDDPRLLGGAWFCAIIKELGGTTPESYRFVEWEQNPTTNVGQEKEEGVFNVLAGSDPGDPAYAIDGGTYAVDDIVFVRRSQSALPNWDIRGPGMPGLTTWGADWRTATFPYPVPASPSDPYFGPDFNQSSDPAEWVVLEDTIIEIPDSQSSVVIHGNLRVAATIDPGDAFADGYAYFSVMAGIVLLGEDCLPLTGAPVFGTNGFGLWSNFVVSGQRLHASSAIVAWFGNFDYGSEAWYGDMPAFGVIDAAAIRDYYVAPVRLAWAVLTPSVQGFPTNWSITLYQTVRPLTFLEWEVRGQPTNTVIGCGSGSGSGSGSGCCDSELSSHPDLNINIPDGVAAGDYTAAWDGSQWRVSITVGDAIQVAVVACVDGIWTLSGREANTSACDPFMASFDGDDFGATGDITVTIA